MGGRAAEAEPLGRFVTAQAPNVRLVLASRPENVMLVREVLVGVAEAAGLEAITLNDIRTAVTEACNNVVLHAYEGSEGPLELEVYGSDDEVEVVVRDHGTGIRPQISSSQDGSSGVGLLVIQALADRVVFQGAGVLAGRAGWDGTEVCMSFAAPGSQKLVIAREDRETEAAPSDDLAYAELATTTAVSVAPWRVTSTVLPRLLSALAARARFSADRISDAQLLADELATRARRDSPSGRLSLAAVVGQRDLLLRITPPRGARAQPDALAPAGFGAVIERLTDDQHLASVGHAQTLDLRMLDRR